MCARVCACVRSDPSAVVAHVAAAGQAGVEVGDAVRAAHRRVLVDPAATVDVAAAGQIPVGHGQSGSARGRGEGGDGAESREG